MEAIVRVRPQQIVRHRQLVSALEYGDASFEIVIDRPLSTEDFSGIQSLASHVVATTVVINRSIDTEAVVESLPREACGAVALLAPVESGDRFFSPDTVYGLMASPGLRDLPSIGVEQGHSRFLETGVRATPREARPAAISVRVSVIVPFHLVAPIACLEALSRQTLNRSKFEVVVVVDRAVNDDLFEVERWIRAAPRDFCISLYVLDSKGTSPSDFRAGLARNAGAFHARGDLLVFLDADAVAPPELLEDALEAHRLSDVIQYRRFDENVETEEYWSRFYDSPNWSSLERKWKYVSSFALSVKLKHFLAVGGFPSALDRYGCEDTFLGWKLDRAGHRFELRNLTIEHVGRSPRRTSTRIKMKRIASSARAFYLCTLDPAVYRLFFPVMGRFPELRWSLRAIAGATR